MSSPFAVDDASPQFARSPAHGGLAEEQLARAERSTQLASLQPSESVGLGGTFIHASEFPLPGSDRGASFPVDTVYEVNSAALDAAFANFGERYDFLPGLYTRLYEIKSRNVWPSSGEFANNAEQSPAVTRDFFLMRAEEATSLSPSSRASLGIHAAVASDVEELAASASAAVSIGSQEGRTAVVDPKTFALAGTSRGWTDSLQGLGNLGGEGLSLGSSPGETPGPLALSNAPLRGSLVLAALGLDATDVTTWSYPAVPNDTILISLESFRQEWFAWAPQVAPLLTEGVSMGVTALELGMRALTEPILDAGSPPHNVLYWVGISSWLLAGALAGETLRRRFPRLETSELSSLGGLPDLLRRDRA